MSELASANEPLILSDGTKVDPITGKVIKDKITVPSHSQAVKQITQLNKKVVDLPDLPKNLNIVNIVLTYHLFGLNDKEIAIATEVSLDVIKRIKMSDNFSSMHTALLESLRNETKTTVRDIITNHTLDAASTIATLLESDDDKVALQAAKDFLDRDGHRPTDIVEHRHQMEGGLEIIHIHKNKHEEETPVIDIAKESLI